MDGLAQWLRDTSVSLGLSPNMGHRGIIVKCVAGDQGVEIDPTEGVGYDVVFNRKGVAKHFFKCGYLPL